jgi:hypothetical protein
VSGLLIFGVFLSRYPAVWRLYRAGEGTTSGRFLLFSFGYFFSLTLFLFWAALCERESWPLVAGISAQLLYGLRLFARLLLRAN